MSTIQELLVVEDIRNTMVSVAKACPQGPAADWGLGNPARKPPQKARAVRAAVADEHGGNYYAKSNGMDQTRYAVSKFSKDIDGIDLHPDRHIWISECGTCWLLDLLLIQLLKERFSGDMVDVYLPVPYYGRHVEATELPYVRAHFVKYGNGRSYLDCLEEKFFNARGGVVVISSVDNPTTTVLSEEEMRRAVDFTQQRDMILFVDDAYRHVYRHIPIPSIFKVVPSALYSRVVATLSWSKAWQWPGLKGGALLGNKDIIDKAFKAKSRFSEGGDPATQAAMAAAVLDYQYLEDTREVYRKLEGRIVTGLRDAGWEEAVGSPASIFLNLPTPKQLGMTAYEVSLAFARNGTTTFPFEMFCGKDRIRLCMKGSDDEIERSLQRIKRYLKD